MGTHCKCFESLEKHRKIELIIIIIIKKQKTAWKREETFERQYQNLSRLFLFFTWDGRCTLCTW